MGMRRIGLLMEDMDYCKALVKWLSMCSQGMVFQELGEREVFSDFDVLLIEGKYIFSEATGSVPSIILSSVPSEYDIDNMTLFKYQGSKSLLNDLLFVFSRLKAPNYETKNSIGAHIAAFYSNYGGQGVTSVAITVAHLLGAKNKKVLYVNLEGINSASDYLDYEWEETDKLLLFAMDCFKSPSLERYVKDEGVFEYLDVGIINKICWLNSGLVDKAFESIKEKCDYDYIILDLGKYLEKAGALNFQEIMGFEVISYENVLSKELESEDKLRIINRFPYGDNPYEGFILHIEPESFTRRDNRKSINPYSHFASETRRIVDHILTMGDKNE